jgi:hypothetical protein
MFLSLQQLNSEKIAMDFWYELDYYSNDYTRYGGGYSDLSKEMNDAISVLKNFYFSNYTQLRSGSTTFVNIIGKGRKNPDIDDAVKLVSKRVKDIMTYHFGKDLDQEQSKSLQEQAFIYFGQGTLFDDTPSNRTPSRTRRPLDFMVHMMDGAVAFYAFWHFIINYYDIITLHEDNTFWTQLDKYLGLGAEIHHKKIQNKVMILEG